MNATFPGQILLLDCGNFPLMFSDFSMLFVIVYISISCEINGVWALHADCLNILSLQIPWMNPRSDFLFFSDFYPEWWLVFIKSSNEMSTHMTNVTNTIIYREVFTNISATTPVELWPQKMPRKSRGGWRGHRVRAVWPEALNLCRGRAPLIKRSPSPPIKHYHN